jgi:RNA polymerase sigma-B factor
VSEYLPDNTDALFTAYLQSGDPDIKGEIVQRFTPLAAKTAGKFVRQGVEFEDLYQVAMMSLLRAIDRFDVSKGVKFGAFALPTVIGDIKHYIRDYSTAMRMPRTSSELASRLRRAEMELVGSLGRYPTTGELAAHVGVPEDKALEALEAASSMQFMSIDGADNPEGEQMDSLFGMEDSGYDRVISRETIRYILKGLKEQERKILVDRYIHGKTQAEMARELGVTQMTVSRMERKIIETLRVKHF